MLPCLSKGLIGADDKVCPAPLLLIRRLPGQDGIKCICTETGCKSQKQDLRPQARVSGDSDMPEEYLVSCQAAQAPLIAVPRLERSRLQLHPPAESFSLSDLQDEAWGSASHQQCGHTMPAPSDSKRRGMSSRRTACC